MWKAPTARIFKLNCNTAVNVFIERCGLGAIIRGEFGSFCATAVPGCLDVTAAEGLAVHEGLFLACELGCKL